MHFHGLLLRRTGGALPASCHWVRVPVAEGQMYRLAGLGPMPAGDDLHSLRRRCWTTGQGADWLKVSDTRRGVLRVAVVFDGALEACLFLARDPAALPAEAALIPMLGAPVPGRSPRRRCWPAGCTAPPPPRGRGSVPASASPAMRSATPSRRTGCALGEEIGVLLSAGTNCGSCIPELEEILRDVRMPAE